MLIAQDNHGAIEWSQGGPAKHFAWRKPVGMKSNYVIVLVENG